LVAANRAGARPIDPRERELLEMLSEYLAVAIRNSRLYGEVAETKQSLERLISSAGDAIISLDASGRIQGWNPAAGRIFGSLCPGRHGQPAPPPRCHSPPAPPRSPTPSRRSRIGRPAPHCPASTR